MTRESTVLSRRIKAKEDMLVSMRPTTTPEQKETPLYKQIDEEYETAKNRNTLDRLAVGARGIGDNLILGLGGLTDSAIEATTGYKSEPTQMEVDAQKNVDRERNIQGFDEEIQGGGSNPAYAIPEAAAFIAPTARIGLIGKGASGLAKTVGINAGADYAISKALNKSDEEAMQNAIFAGTAMGSLDIASKVAKRNIVRTAAKNGETPTPEDIDINLKSKKHQEEFDELDSQIQFMKGNGASDDVVKQMETELRESAKTARIDDETFDAAKNTLESTGRTVANEDIVYHVLKERSAHKASLENLDVKEVASMDDLFKKGPSKVKLSELESKGLVSEENVPLLNKLIDMSGDIDVYQNVKKLAKEHNGEYDIANNVIHLSDNLVDSKNAMETILHEATHAATTRELAKNKTALKELKELFDVAKKNVSATGQDKYWKENIFEMMSEGTVNPKVIKQLESVSAKNTGLWNKVKSVLMRVIGKKLDGNAKQQLDKILDDMYKSSTGKDAPKIEPIKGESTSNPFSETVTNFKASYKTGGKYDTYQKIHSKTRDALNEAARAGAEAKNSIHKMFKESGVKVGGEFDKGFTKHILNTDYASIREFKNVSEAMSFLRKNLEVYKKAKRYIDQSAKGLKDKGAMNHPDYTNNGSQIAKRAGLDSKHADTIEKLVSIKSMSKEDWNFVAKNSNTKLFEDMVEFANTLNKQSQDIFSDSVQSRVKGYQSEIYDSIYRYEMGDNGFEKLVDAEVGMVQGGLPQKLDNARTGEIKQFPKGMKNASKEQKLAYSEQNNLGVVLDKYANPVATRRVASEAQRQSIGKSTNASDTMPLTFENSTRKIGQRDGVINDILKTADNDVFSSVKKDGMVELTEKELKGIPSELHDKVRYVNKDFKHMLIGNKQIQMAEAQMTKIIEQLLKDSVGHFKENVVLKNPASWVNNMAYNYFVNLQEGMGVIQTTKYMKKGLKEKIRSENLASKLIKLEMLGKKDTKAYKTIQTELDSNLYYNLDREGLAVTVMSNIMDSPISSKRLSDKMMKQAVKNVFGDTVGEKITTVVSNAYLSPQSKLGQKAMHMFGSIDAMGRYSMAAKELDAGKSMAESIKKANSLYGDLDIIAPKWSQAIQQYGFIPFSNWFFRMSGGASKSILDNKMRAVGVSALLYGLSEITDKRTESMNPLATLVNTPADMVKMSPYFNVSNYAKNVVTPSVYKKTARAIKTGDPISVALTRDF